MMMMWELIMMTTVRLAVLEMGLHRHRSGNGSGEMMN